MRNLALTFALLVPGLPAAAQETCGGSVRVEQFTVGAGPSGTTQVTAIVSNTARTPFGYTAIRTPVPGLEGTTPFGPFILGPGATHHLPLGTLRLGVPISDGALRASLTLQCRL